MNGLNSAAVRTVDVARETSYSVLQIRDLERLGVIPPATRTANRYRSYATVHVHAVRAHRGLAAAIGPVPARRLLSELRIGTIEAAAAAVCTVHVELARAALRVIGAKEAELQEKTDSGEMGISELESALGVLPCTLRHRLNLRHDERASPV